MMLSTIVSLLVVLLLHNAIGTLALNEGGSQKRPDLITWLVLEPRAKLYGVGVGPLVHPKPVHIYIYIYTYIYIYNIYIYIDIDGSSEKITLNRDFFVIFSRFSCPPEHPLVMALRNMEDKEQKNQQAFKLWGVRSRAVQIESLTEQHPLQEVEAVEQADLCTQM